MKGRLYYVLGYEKRWVNKGEHAERVSSFPAKRASGTPFLYPVILKSIMTTFPLDLGLSVDICNGKSLPRPRACFQSTKK